MLLRRIRGTLGTMLTWTFGWSAAGAVYGLLQDLWQHIAHPLSASVPLAVILPGSMLIFGIFGAVAGGVFAGILALAERDRRFVDLSARRVMQWGALAGAALPTLMLIEVTASGGQVPGDVLFVIATNASLGATIATGTLAVARRAADREADEPLVTA